MHFVYHLTEADVVVYVGRSVNPTQRLGDHRRNHGRDLKQTIVLVTDDFRVAAEREVEDIAAFKPELNLRIQSSPGRLGMPISEATRAAISAANTGRVRSAETRAKLRAANLGKTLSQEVRDKIAAGNTGKKMSPEAVAKTRAARLGHVTSEATKAKLRAAWEKRKARGDAVASFKGATHSEETRAKMRAAWEKRKGL